jgi:hypothetical protein
MFLRLIIIFFVTFIGLIIGITMGSPFFSGLAGMFIGIWAACSYERPIKSKLFGV